MADEELGKKDDDHKRRSDREHLWHSKSQWRLPRRRSLLVLVALYLLYLFFKNMPTDLTPVRERPVFAQSQQIPPAQWSRPAPSPAVPDQNPPSRGVPAADNKQDFYYEGEVKFYGLAASLRLFQKLGSHRGAASRDVVIAGASLESISDLLPLACRMASQKTNEVHFVLMGRDDISIEGLQRVNGISNEDCPINWHDARPDYAQFSTDGRMERAVAVGLKYVYAYIRPQVIITHGESLEQAFFLTGSRSMSREFGFPHITLPSVARNLMWISTLDTHALRVWNDIRVEFLVNAQPESSGSLIRLVRSLQEADYLGSTPGLTIELPADVDPQLLHFLKTLDWPPAAAGKLTIRRRIQLHHLDPAEASLKTVEAFYPKDPNVTHALMLSPQTELAPSFYHYLMYTMLKYKYSARYKQLGSGLFGVSLELPSTHITDDEPFTPPISESDGLSNNAPGRPSPSFLWQAPNTNAALYFGDKWVELHSFLSKRLSILATTPDSSVQERIVSKKYPAVMEYLLELIRAKGYYLLYPAFPASGAFSLATVHNELYRFPEEYSDGKAKSADEPPTPIDDPSKPLTADFGQLGAVEKPLSQASTVMPLLDEFSSELVDIDHLPVLSYQGNELSGLAFSRQTEEYAQQFRSRYGGCNDDRVVNVRPDDLFCLSG